MNEVVRLEGFFPGVPDRCERLISGLNFCLQLSMDKELCLEAEEQLYSVVEKGALYRGMFYDFSELRLIDQIQTILEKFAEFERLYVPQTQIEIYRMKHTMLMKTEDVIKKITATLPSPSAALSVPLPTFFLLLEFGDVILVLRLVNNSPCEALIVSTDVSYTYLNGFDGLCELLEPWIQRLVATAATATAPQLEDNNEDGHFRDLEYEGMVELNILILLCGEAAQVAGLEGTGVSSDLEKTLQSLRKEEKIHSLKSLRKRISVFEKNESGHSNDRPLIEYCHSMASMKSPGIGPSWTPARSNSPSHFCLNDVIKRKSSEDQQEEGIVTTRSLVVDKGESVQRAFHVNPSKDNSELHDPSEVEGDSHDKGCKQGSEDGKIRESLMNEIMESRASEDCVEFGLRAYMAIRDNAFAHKDDWAEEGNCRESSGDKIENLMDVTSSTAQSAMSLSGEFDIVGEMEVNTATRSEHQSSPRINSGDNMSESLDIDTKMQNYIKKIVALRESLCEEDDEVVVGNEIKKSDCLLDKELSSSPRTSQSQMLPLPPTASFSSNSLTEDTDATRSRPPPLPSAPTNSSSQHNHIKSMPKADEHSTSDLTNHESTVNNDIGVPLKTPAENHVDDVEDVVHEDPSLLEFEAAARKHFDEQYVDVTNTPCAEIEEDRVLGTGYDDCTQRMQSPSDIRESEVVDLCRSIEKSSTVQNEPEFHHEAPIRSTYPIPDTPLMSPVGNNTEFHDETADNCHDDANIEADHKIYFNRSLKDPIPSLPSYKSYDEYPEMFQKDDYKENDEMNTCDVTALPSQESMKSNEKATNSGNILSVTDKESADTAIQSTIRRLLSLEKQKIDESWRVKQEKRAQLRAKKGRDIFMHLQATTVARARVRKTSQRQKDFAMETGNKEITPPQGALHNPGDSAKLESSHVLSVHAAKNEARNDRSDFVEPNWMVNCDKLNEEDISSPVKLKPQQTSKVKTGPPTVSELRALVNEDGDHDLQPSQRHQVYNREQSLVQEVNIRSYEEHKPINVIDRSPPPVPTRREKTSLPVPVSSNSQKLRNTGLSERERIVRERGVSSTASKESSGSASKGNTSSAGYGTKERKKWSQSPVNKTKNIGEDITNTNDYYIHIPVDDSATVDTTDYENNIVEGHVKYRNVEVGQEKSVRQPSSVPQRVVPESNKKSTSTIDAKRHVMSTITTPQDDPEDEKRRLAKFEQMRKRKMEEAAIAKEQKELLNLQRGGGYENSYAVREIERQRLANLDKNKSDMDSVRKDEPDNEKVGKDEGKSSRGNRMRGEGAEQRPQRQAPPPPSRRNDALADIGGKDGYLRQHEEESANEREMRELEEEVANMITPSPASNSRNGPSNKTPRSHSANPSYRRPTGQLRGSNAPSPGSSRRDGSNSVKSEGGRIRNVATSPKGRPRAASAGRAGARKKGRLNNSQQIRNALNMVCLAGSAHATTREEALSAIEDCLERGNKEDGAIGPLQFLIVMHQSKMLSFKGLYLVDSFTGDICKLTGRGPKQLSMNLISEYFKYESSSRTFRKLPTITLTSICDAVSIDPTKLKKSTASQGKKHLY